MEDKYIKYKTKYLNLKNMFGGVLTPEKTTNDDELATAVQNVTLRDAPKQLPMSDSTRALFNFATKMNPAKNVSTRSSKLSEIATESVRKATIQSIKIGEGSAGCVYSPPFKCNYPQCTGDRCTHGISKIMSKDNADIEYNKYDLLGIDRIDPDFRYHFSQPHKCSPQITRGSISDCRVFINEPSMLVYDNGGFNLNDLISKFKIANSPESLIVFINLILRNLINIVEGIILLNRHGICHFDIKSLNIVTSVKSIESLDELHLKLIDFGMSIKYDIPLIPEYVLNGINGYHYSRIKKNISAYFPYFSIDTLFLGLFNTTNITKDVLEYIIKTVGDYFYYLVSNSQLKNLIVLRNIYKLLNYTYEKITEEFIELYTNTPMDVILRNYLESHDSFQFGLMLTDVCLNLKNQKIQEALVNFLVKSKAIHYNPLKRCRSIDLIDHYNKFLLEIA